MTTPSSAAGSDSWLFLLLARLAASVTSRLRAARSQWSRSRATVDTTRVVAAATTAAAALLLLGLGCSQPPTPETGFPRQEAISEGTEQAKRSVPEQEMRDARIDAATAELITLEEANRRLDLHSLDGDSQGRGLHTPVWWVSVRGAFTFTGMAPPRGTPAVYEARERIVIYDANTGERIQDTILSSHQLTPAVVRGTIP